MLITLILFVVVIEDLVEQMFYQQLYYILITGSGERNPYCRVGIMNQKHYHPGAEFKYMSEWQRSGDVTEVATTDCRMATLEPMWNEDVEL